MLIGGWYYILQMAVDGMYEIEESAKISGGI